jgi:hypothetical protein
MNMAPSVATITGPRLESSGRKAKRPPGKANRAAEGEACLIEIREAGGRLLRMATPHQAEEIIKGGAGDWYGYGARLHIRLTIDLPGHSLDSLHSLQGCSSIATHNKIGKLYHHNTKALLGMGLNAAEKAVLKEMDEVAPKSWPVTK